MAPQSEGDAVIRINPIEGNSEKGVVSEALAKPFYEADELRDGGQATDVHEAAAEPSEEALERGAAETIAFFESATGKKVSVVDGDVDAKRILYELFRQRASWSKDLERESRTALQYHFPDVGGSAVHGPL